MAKRVIQMYDKYKSTTKTYPKIIKECLQEDVTNYIEGQVEANPELAGTEADLESITIKGTKYKVGGGKQLYRHYIELIYNYSTKFYLILVLDLETNQEIDTMAKLEAIVPIYKSLHNTNHLPINYCYCPQIDGTANNYFITGISSVDLTNNYLFFDYRQIFGGAGQNFIQGANNVSIRSLGIETL